MANPRDVNSRLLPADITWDQIRKAIHRIHSGGKQRLDVAMVTGAVPDTRQVIAGTGMSGGGPLSADVTLNCTITQWSNELVDDRVAALIQNGTGITWSYNDGAGTLTPAVTITQYTDEMVDDRVAALIQNGTGITWAYNDGAGTLTPTVTITQYTDEMAQDAVGGMLTDSATIDFTYNDGAATITAIVIDSSIGTVKLGGDITTAGKAILDDATNVIQRATLGVTGMLTAVRIYTVADSGNNWSKPANLDFVIVEVVGPGGGGGGCTSGLTTMGVAGGGGAGGWARKKIAAASLGATEVLTIGDGGAGATAGANNGSPGTATTSFGAHATAGPGQGGTGGAASGSAGILAAGAPGAGASGDLNMDGMPATQGIRINSTSGVSGHGGNTPYGGGGPGRHSSGAGNPGTGKGSGGGGAQDNSNGGNRAGGAGAPGVIIVYEFSV